MTPLSRRRFLVSLLGLPLALRALGEVGPVRATPSGLRDIDAMMDRRTPEQCRLDETYSGRRVPLTTSGDLIWHYRDGAWHKVHLS